MPKHYSRIIHTLERYRARDGRSNVAVTAALAGHREDAAMGNEAAASQATLLHEHDSGKIQSRPTVTQKIVNGPS